MNADELARRIVVRQREPGYLRLELPAEICHEAALTSIDASLRQLAGVYRVSAYGTDRRLVVWYDRHIGDAALVARKLKACLPLLPEPDTTAATTAASAIARNPRPSVTRQVQEGFAAMRGKLATLQQPSAPDGSLQARLQPVLTSALSEKAITNFLNDVVAFYLIKMHWELITKRWLQEPLKHANAWLTMFYLVFLLVRYRKSLNKPAPVAVPAPTAES